MRAGQLLLFAMKANDNSDLNVEKAVITAESPLRNGHAPNVKTNSKKNFDEVLREVMVREGWAEDELSRVSMRQFVKAPVATLIPDPTESEDRQRAVFARTAVGELQARIDGVREMKGLDEEGEI